MARNHELALAGRDALADVLGLPSAAPAPDEMLGSMVALPLPDRGPLAAAGAGSSPLDTDPLQRRLLDEQRIEVPIGVWPVPAAESPDPSRRVIRISSALHNGPGDVERLAGALAEIGSGSASRTAASTIGGPEA
jgi:selenocysteine lyase/cysteine desulfurase